MLKESTVTVLFLETFDLLLHWSCQVAWTPETCGHAQNSISAGKVSIAILQSKVYIFCNCMILPVLLAHTVTEHEGAIAYQIPITCLLWRGSHPLIASLGFLELQSFSSIWADTVQCTWQILPSFVISVLFKWLTIMLALVLVLLFLCGNI